MVSLIGWRYTEAKYVSEGVARSRICDVIERKHPACEGITRFENWDTWNETRGVVYNSYIQPLSECVVVSSPNYKYGDGAEYIWGMLVADINVGKGKCFFSQVEATQKYNEDSVATRYINNLLKYTLQDYWKGEFSGNIRGVKKELTILPEDKTVCIDLRPYCNMEFKDDAANDQKGGWDDNGPNNDIRDLSVGKQMFSMVGVTFDIIDPDRNGGKSCIVLSGTPPKPFFPLKVEGIKVRQALKRLFFLHTFSYGDTGEIAGYIINYGDGTKEEIKLVSGKNIGGWWWPKDLPNALVAWSGACKSCNSTCIYMMEWKNPNPGKVIESIDFISKNLGAVPILVAISGEKK